MKTNNQNDGKPPITKNKKSQAMIQQQGGKGNLARNPDSMGGNGEGKVGR